MKSILFILCILFASNAFSKNNSIDVGVLYKKIFTTKKEANIAIKIWLKHMKKKPYFEGVNIILYDDEQKMLDDYIATKITGMISNLTHYFKNKDKIDKSSKYKWVLSTTKKIYDEYYLIRNIESTGIIEKLNTYDFYYKDDIGKIWLESYLLKIYKKPIEKIFHKIKEIKKPRKLLFDVFFNKNTVSVVSKRLYDSMIKLNPQIKEQTKIVKKSKPIFVSAIGFTHKHIDETYNKRLEQLTLDINNSAKAIELISLIDLARIKVIEDNELEELELFYEEYFKLKNSIK